MSYVSGQILTTLVAYLTDQTGRTCGQHMARGLSTHVSTNVCTAPFFFMLDWMNILGMGVYYGLFGLKQCVKTIILLLQPFLSTLSRDGQSRGFSQGPGWPGWSLPESFVRGYGN